MNRLLHLTSSVCAFVISVYAVSNLLPLLLESVRNGLNVQYGISIGANAAATTLSVLILAGEIYRLDRRAGRIHNRVRWFE